MKVGFLLFLLISVSAGLAFFFAIRGPLFAAMAKRAERKERERIRHESIARSTDLLRLILADPETAVLIREGLNKALDGEAKEAEEDEDEEVTPGTRRRY